VGEVSGQDHDTKDGFFSIPDKPQQPKLRMEDATKRSRDRNDDGLEKSIEDMRNLRGRNLANLAENYQTFSRPPQSFKQHDSVLKVRGCSVVPEY
jgi:hypothetical protein